jgi:TetR/AcrR family transcriptional regulator
LSIENFNRLPGHKRKEILDAVAAEFASSGYEAASTNRIVKQAQISKGVLFKYFSNKENLFLYVCRHISDERVQWLSVQPDDPSLGFFGTLRYFALRDLAFIMKEPIYYFFLDQVRKNPSHPIHKKAMNILNEKGKQAFEAIMKASPQNDLREDVTITDAMHMIQWVFNGFNPYMQEKVQGNFEAHQEEIVREVDKVFDLLKYGIGKHSE